MADKKRNRLVSEPVSKKAIIVMADCRVFGWVTDVGEVLVRLKGASVSYDDSPFEQLPDGGAVDIPLAKVEMIQYTSTTTSSNTLNQYNDGPPPVKIAPPTSQPLPEEWHPNDPFRSDPFRINN